MRITSICFLFILIISSCKEEEELVIFSTECADCIQYEYQQAYNDTFFSAVLDSATYCLGDSVFTYTDLVSGSVQFLEILDEELLNLMTDNGYCTFLVDTIIE